MENDCKRKEKSFRSPRGDTLFAQRWRFGSDATVGGFLLWPDFECPYLQHLNISITNTRRIAARWPNNGRLRVRISGRNALFLWYRSSYHSQTIHGGFSHPRWYLKKLCWSIFMAPYYEFILYIFSENLR